MTTARLSRAKRSIDDVLAEARSRLGRLEADEVPAALARGAVLVDIRPAAQRAREGELADILPQAARSQALVIERNVLEWRCDPSSGARVEQAEDHDVEWVILCSEGYTSSLAAASLQDLGLWKATDVVGGYRALRRRLPQQPGGRRRLAVQAVLRRRQALAH